MPHHPLHEPVLRWYDGAARDLPWRAPGTDGWGVLVSEVMSQQTPVARVAPVWVEWMARWPKPSALAAATPAEVVRAWGRLGYPRRALRLRDCAAALAADHGDVVPSSYDELVALPGVGDYTAAAVASFAYGRRHAVLDTNVRRVQARAVGGDALPAVSPTATERRRAVDLLPDDDATAARWAVAVMELGALVCTARSPACTACPIADRCAWHVAGRPAYDGPARRTQAWEGTDRQVRGRIMAMLRAAHAPVPLADLDDTGPREQRLRCLDSLVADGLVEPLAGSRYRLPEG